MLADRQTDTEIDRHTDRQTDRNTPLPSWDGVKWWVKPVWC